MCDVQRRCAMCSALMSKAALLRPSSFISAISCWFACPEASTTVSVTLTAGSWYSVTPRMPVGQCPSCCRTSPADWRFDQRLLVNTWAWRTACSAAVPPFMRVAVTAGSGQGADKDSCLGGQAHRFLPTLLLTDFVADHAADRGAADRSHAAAVRKIGYSDVVGAGVDAGTLVQRRHLCTSTKAEQNSCGECAENHSSHRFHGLTLPLRQRSCCGHVSPCRPWLASRVSCPPKVPLR